MVSESGEKDLDLETGNDHGSQNGSENLGVSQDNNAIFTQKYRSSLPQNKAHGVIQTLLLAYQSLGIVYGDIGTSPLYVISSVTLDDPSEEDFLGIFSLVFWTLTAIPLIKYALIVLRADDHGEGGTFALYSYLNRHINFRSKFAIQNTRLVSDANMKFYTQGRGIRSKTKDFIEESVKLQTFLTILVLIGTAMVIGDGALTPATSVLSALAGIQKLSSKLTAGVIYFAIVCYLFLGQVLIKQHAALPFVTDHVAVISIVLLIGLFCCQSFGTSKIGFTFSPIMFLWFACNTLIGVYNIVKYYPSALKAISPYYVIKYFQSRGRTGWESLGAIFLCTTGAEAMYADLGHFNKRSIQLAFSLFVYPSLVLSYGGQVAFLIKNPDEISTVFYSAIPKSVYWPMFIVATLAAAIASQAMISATFSIVKQSLSLGCFPRVNIKHTSSKHEGQIYSPEINYILMIICVVLVAVFKEGVEIGNAYGVAVIWVMIITTCLVTLVMLVIWDINFLLILTFFIPFIAIEGIFMTSLLNKLPDGGWVPFAITAFFLIIMLSWTHGRSKKTTYDANRKMDKSELDNMVQDKTLHRPPGICFFCTDLVNGIPPIIRHYIQVTNSLREITIIVTVRTLPIKTVLPEERIDVGKLGFDGVYRCLIQFGYKDKQSLEGDEVIASVLKRVSEIAENPKEAEKLSSASEKDVVFVTGRTILKSNKNHGWLSRFTTNYLYRFLQKNSTSTISSLEIPPGKLLQVGMLYEI